MFSVVIATSDSERALVPTLAALVPGATAGIVREVIIADGGSRDETEQVADIAGCRFFSSDEPLGGRLKAAAAMGRCEWLMFLRPGIVPGWTWVDETTAFVQRDDADRRAAAFALEIDGVVAWLNRALSSLPGAEQGLVLRKSFYEELGGHLANASDSETDLFRRIGRRRIVRLRTIAARSII